MSDQHLSQELLDHGHRIAQLELKVAELYRRIGESGASDSGAGDGFAEPAPIAPDDHPRVIELIQAGNEIGAIKLYREIAGVGLAEAKDACDRLALTHRPTS